MSEVINWATLAKTSVTSSQYIPVTGRVKFQFNLYFQHLLLQGQDQKVCFQVLVIRTN